MDPEEAELWALIDRRCVEGAGVDASIWARFGAERAVMYTDLAGFSRRVAEFGIIHFLQVIHEHRRLVVPIVEAHGGRVTKIEADSLLIQFDRVQDALTAAIAMQRACDAHNADRPPQRQVLLCIGLGFGRVLRIGDVDLYGVEVNATSKLGEDTARAHEILATEAFCRQLGPREGVAVEEIGVPVAGSEHNYRVRVIAAP